MSEPAGLYVHVPFCAKVCPYCDFAVRRGGEPEHDAYVEALAREIALHDGAAAPFDTIYLGGGTPSALSPARLGRVLDALRDGFGFAGTPRIFLEANPEDVDDAAVRAWRELGVATLSLGVQAMDDAGLDFLGRAHRVADVRRAVAAARRVGFDTLSIDLIYGRPGQSLDGWRAEIAAAVALEPDHVSAYQLTIEPRTRFGSLAAAGRLTPLRDGEQADFFRATHEALAAAGFPAYEVSQFARSPEHRSRHNTKYWRRVPYLGLGPSAHSFDGTTRWWNRRKMSDWVAAIDAGSLPIEARETLTREQELLERLMVGFRTVDGVDLRELRDELGVDLVATNRARIEEWRTRGLVRVDAERLRPTMTGLSIADALAADVRITR